MSAREDFERWGGAAAFGTARELTAMQTLMWRAERHPVQSSTTTVIIDLDRAPDWTRFVAATEWGTGLVRRLRQRVVDPVVPTAAPTWADDPTFDLGYHLRRERVSSREEMLAQAAQMALRPFDRSRPLWEGVLFEGVPRDGERERRTSSRSTTRWPTRWARSSCCRCSSRASGRTPPASRWARSTAEPGATRSSSPCRGCAPTSRPCPRRRLAAARNLGVAATRPQAAVASALRYGASVRRLLTQAATPSPELSPRTGRKWTFLTLDAPLEPLRTVARQGGGTLDDAAVALVLGGLRRYHARRDSSLPELPVGVRVSLDRADDLGNRFAGALISGPLAIEDPVDRVAAVRGEVLSLHTERALQVLDSAAPVMNRMPSFVGASALRTAAVPDAFVLTLPGPPRRRYMAGAEVQGMYVLGPLPGAALTVCLVTCGDTACIGVNVDASAVADLDELEECLAEGVEEMVAAAG